MKEHRVTAFQEPAKDYHGTVAQRYGVDNLARNKANVSKEYLKLVRSLPEGFKVELKDRVYDEKTGNEVIGQMDPSKDTVTIGTKEWRENTAYHESLHAHMEMIARTDTKLHKEILDEAVKKYGITENVARE